MVSETRYALRLLAPYQGVLQIVDTGEARAMSPDGIEWQVQVRVGTRNPVWGEFEGDEDETRLMVYGLWTQDTGLVRLPFDPMADMAEARAQAEDMVTRLPAAMAQAPFPLADQHELWLLDTEAQPLALLASVRRGDPLPAHVRSRWQGSPSMHFARHLYELDGDGLARLQASGDEMARLVEQAAGTRPETRWIDRSEPHPELDFPPAGVRHRWPEADQQTVADDWLCWQAPLLLMLPELDAALRARLEEFAMRQVSSVARYWRSWPEVIDRDRLQAALVAARLQAGAAQD